MKIAFLADNQVDERSRLEEHDRVMEFIAADSMKRGCQYVLHGGDIYERRSTARERSSVADFLLSVAHSTGAVVVVAGNHEAPGEVEELNLLDPGIRATERPKIERFVTDESASDAVAVACLPWPRRSSLAAWVGKPLGREELNAVGLDAMRSILRGFAQEWKDWKGPKILLAHAMVRGSKQGPDQPIMPGQDFELGLEDLALAEAHVNLLGHVHMPQEWNGTGYGLGTAITPGPADTVPSIYAGSPRRTAYASGELEPKGYVVLEFDGPRLVKWERVPTPATAMILHETTFIPGVVDGPSGHFDPRGPEEVPPGAEVRLRWTVDADHREEAREKADLEAERLHDNGAAEVKCEEIVRPRSVARLAAVSGDKPLAEKIALVWDRDGVAAERRPSLLARLAELEGGGA